LTPWCRFSRARPTVMSWEGRVMSYRISCPACRASVRLSRKPRGRKLFCPKCRRALVVTSTGKAKRDERASAAAALPPPDRNWNVLLLVLVAAVLLVPGGLSLVLLLSRGEPNHPTQVAQQSPPVRPPERILPQQPPAREGSKAPDRQDKWEPATGGVAQR